MKQVTLVSLYGEKRNDFAALISKCQELVKSTPGVKFEAYDIRQIHATIFGLERKIGSTNFNLNFSKYRGRDVAMNFDGVVEFLRRSGHFPLEIEVGGFNKRDYPFSSRQNTPFERSFSIQKEKVVVMGWPIRGKPLTVPPTTIQSWAQEARLYPDSLDQIRHAAQGFGILHGYHQRPVDVDNDLFFRIGLIDPGSLPEDGRSALETRVRQMFCTEPPPILDIRIDDLCLASYEDDTLPLSSTQTWPLTDPRLTASFITALYS